MHRIQRTTSSHLCKCKFATGSKACTNHLVAHISAQCHAGCALNLLQERPTAQSLAPPPLPSAPAAVPPPACPRHSVPHSLMAALAAAGPAVAERQACLRATALHPESAAAPQLDARASHHRRPEALVQRFPTLRGPACGQRPHLAVAHHSCHHACRRGQHFLKGLAPSSSHHLRHCRLC